MDIKVPRISKKLSSFGIVGWLITQNQTMNLGLTNEMIYVLAGLQGIYMLIQGYIDAKKEMKE